jgi:hypothetical protein
VISLLAASLLVAPPGTIATSDQPITVDGKLDDGAWAEAPVHDLGHQKEPHGGQDASLPATWQAVVVGKVLYVGVRCEAGDIAVIARRTRRDRAVESDRVTVDIDTRGRGQDAFHFEVTAGGSLVDGVRYNDTVLDLQWDSYWDAEVSVDDEGWTAEFEIPLRLLRRPPGETQPINIQVRRYISKLGETDEWSPTPRDKSREVSAYAPVVGLILPRKRAALDLLPYLTGGAKIETPGGTFSTIQRGGFDAKLQIGSDVTIDVTAYPDFGTVEADTAVFNLTPVEVRFPEKRPFFLEGTDVLSTPLELFYSRRIGSLTGTTAGVALKTPPPAPVLAAAKLLARAGRHWSFAGLVATTGRQSVDVQIPDTYLTSPQRVAPTYLYGVLRIRRELPHGGYVGMIGSSRTSFERGPLQPWTTCPDGGQPVRKSCFADVYALGPDLRLRSRNSQWVGTAQLVGTFRYGGTPQVFLDGIKVESGEFGASTVAGVEKVGGRVIGNLRHEWYGRNADWNATGYLPRPNHHAIRGQIGLQNLTPHGKVFEDRWQLEYFQRLSLDGLNMGSGYQVNHRARWKSFWYSFVELHYRPRYYDNREARDGTPFQRTGLLGLELTLNSDPRRVVVGGFDGVYQQRWNSFLIDQTFNLDFNVFGALQWRLGVTATVDRGEPRWVETDFDNGVYRIARLYAHALGLLTRANYTITPKLELQLYAQLLGVGTIHGQGYLAAIGADRIELATLVKDPNFIHHGETEALLVANLFLRWQYAPGSNVYLVATRNQVDPFKREFRALADVTHPNGNGWLDYRSVGHTPASYTFLVKATVLLGW